MMAAARTKSATIRFDDRHFTAATPQGTWELWYRSEIIKTSGNKKQLVKWAENHGYDVLGGNL